MQRYRVFSKYRLRIVRIIRVKTNKNKHKILRRKYAFAKMLLTRDVIDIKFKCG